MTDVKQMSGEKPQNPANAPGKNVAERRRIPMSVPQQKLAAPDMPGYHLHWMRGNRQRIAQAQRAGYEFVSEADLLEFGGLNNTDLGGGPEVVGSTDLGTRVSVVSGDEFGPDGQAERLYLMKIKEEWWRESQAILEERNESIAEAIRGGNLPPAAGSPEQPGDVVQRYGGMKQAPLVGIRRQNVPQHLFVRKTAKGA